MGGWRIYWVGGWRWVGGRVGAVGGEMWRDRLGGWRGGTFGGRGCDRSMVSLSMAGGRYRDGGYGGGYYSVCFLEEFVTCFGAFAG